MADLSWPIIIGAAAIDSVNPCAFGVLIFLLTYMSKVVGDYKKMFINGLIYIAGVFITYILAGVILLKAIQSLTKFSTIAYIALGILIIIAGLVEIKDFFWYGRGFSLAIMPGEKKRIQAYVSRIAGTRVAAFGLGIFVALVELPCTGMVYLAILALMSSIGGLTITNMSYLLVYNLIFVLPLIVILVSVYKGMSTLTFKLWLEKNKKMMRLLVGLLLIALGVWMIMRTI